MPKKPKYNKKRKTIQRNRREISQQHPRSRHHQNLDADKGCDDYSLSNDLPTWTKQENVVDYLSEDEPISGQKFYCISSLSLSKWRTGKQRTEAIEMICSKEGYDCDMAKSIIDSWSEFEESKRAYKFRGVYSDYKKAKKRADFIQQTHRNHNVAVFEVGYWAPFDPDPEKAQDQNFLEKEMNDLKEGYTKNKAKGKAHWEKEKTKRAAKARLEGSKWGQQMLMEHKETRLEVENRTKIADQQIKQYQEKIREAEVAKELAFKKLEYMNEHPEVILEETETPDDIEIPEQVQKQLKDSEKKTQQSVEVFETYRKMDEARKPFDPSGAAKALAERGIGGLPPTATNESSARNTVIAADEKSATKKEIKEI